MTARASERRTARWRSLLGVAALSLSACAPAAKSPPHAGEPRLGKVFAAALEAEQHDAMAYSLYLDAIDEALRDPDAPGAVALGFASIDALVGAAPAGFEGVGPVAIAHRSSAAMRTIVARLSAAWKRAAVRSSDDDGSGAPSSSPGSVFLRGGIATALHELALFAGDAHAADVWGSRRGCATTATVFGPLDWTALRALDDAPNVPATGPLPEALPGVAPFAARALPAVVHADACELDVNAPSAIQGLRAVVVDFQIQKAQRAYFALTSSSAAVLDVGGVTTVRRGYDVGGRPTTRLGAIDLPAGRVRAVIRFAQKGDGGVVELDAFGEDGAPLPFQAPVKGDVARSTGTNASPFVVEPASNDAQEVALAAAGLLGLGEARTAEHLLEARFAGRVEGGEKTSPGFDLLLARALEEADDVPDTKAALRVRAAIDRVLAVWPWSWEARIGHARATERRKGASDGLIDALREMTAPRADEKEPDPMGAAYISILSKRLQLFDAVESSYREVAKLAQGSALLAALDGRVHPRSGKDLVRASCEGGQNRAELDCLDAKRDVGDVEGALDEVARLRRLRGAPEGLRDIEIGLRLAKGDLHGALLIYDAMRPGERKLYDAVALAAGRGQRDEVQRRLARDSITARDAPFSVGAITRELGLSPDPAPALEAEGRKIVLEDIKSAFMPGAATAVLQHIERYTIEASGMVHFTTYDLRRVSGTTDVANGSASTTPAIEGRGAPRTLRRRIHKRDGRILEPDPAANASQSSDLSQLETGDYVEQIHEGWSLPGDTGQLVIDTPDLMPERTSVREATIEVRRAASIPLTIWSHPALGKPVERAEASYVIDTWRIEGKAPRRIEEGVPRTERTVGVSLGTLTMADVARGMQENLRALADHDPFVRRFALDAAGSDMAQTPELLARVVAAVGKTVKIASPGDLSDVAGLYSSGAQRTTARTSIELGTGNRSWLVYRMLQELGVAADIAVAEVEPFSSSASYPPHAGRFRHPLVIAHLAAAGQEGSDVWIDADVEGPPLPPGRISPELRGRSAMIASSGKLVTVTGAAGEFGDEVDLRLTLDDKGDARGTFVVILHGRAAQTVAEAFETVVGTDRRELLRSVVLGWVPWADVDEVVASSAAGAWEIVLRAEIAVHGYGRPEGKDGKTWTLAGLEPVHIVFPQRFVGMLAGTFATRGARKDALAIEVPLQYRLRRQITLPAGATVTRSPGVLDVSDPHLTASRTETLKGSILEDVFSLNVPTGTVGADQYQAFVERVHAVDDGFMSGTRVGLTAPKRAPSSKDK